MRIAYAEALKKRGYAKDGSMLDGTYKGEDVIGTVMFMAKEPMMKMKVGEVQMQMVSLTFSRTQDISDTAILTREHGDRIRQLIRYSNFLAREVTRRTRRSKSHQSQ